MDMVKRDFRLDMGYDQMWSLIDDVPTEQLEAEYERLGKLAMETTRESQELRMKHLRMGSKQGVLKNVIERRKLAEMRKSAVETDDHRKLASMLSEEAIREFTANYFDDYRWLARELGWKLPNDDLSDEQDDRLTQLLDELPIFIARRLALTK